MKALVLEGGALRGIYTSGVLDVLLEERLEFDAVYGVSAGALNALNFLSRQPGRFARIALEYSGDPRYMSEENLRRTGDFFGFDFFLGELSRDLLPFDYDTFENNPADFYAVTTDLRTGEPAFLKKGDVDIFRAVVASSSLPLLAKPKEIGGRLYMDGAFSCPLPFERAKAQAEKVLVVTTRERGFRKPPKEALDQEREEARYGAYPQFLRALREAPDLYNAQLDKLDAWTGAGEVFTVYPGRPVTLTGMERDRERLQALCDEGREDMRRQLRELKDYLSDGAAG